MLIEMATNEQTFDLTSIFTKNYNIFFCFGFWKPDNNFRYKTLYNLYTLSCFCILVLFLLPQAIYMIVNRNDILEVTGTMYVFCTFFINFIKTLVIYSNMDVIKQILENFKRNSLLQVICRLKIVKK